MDVRKRFPRSRPSAAGVSAARVSRFLDRVAAERIELHSMMVVRHGQVAAEGFWAPYAPDQPHRLYSLSKSFTATAVGLAQAEGRLRITDPILQYFREEDTESVRAHVKSLEVRHLLMMGTGHEEDTGPMLWQAHAGQWAHAFFQCPITREPGTHFVYNNGATYMLSALVQRVTGQTVRDYLMPRLFEPLGIQDPPWEMSPEGITRGYSGLKVTTEDIAAFGQLYLNHGEWQGHRLLPEEWVREATARHIANGTDPEDDWAQGYGYQFWRSRFGYRGDGAHGQFCFVLPDLDAVIAITAGVGDMRPIFAAVWGELRPALLEGDASSSPAVEEDLAARLKELRIDDLSGEPSGGRPDAFLTPWRLAFKDTGEWTLPSRMEAEDAETLRITFAGPGGPWSVRAGISRPIANEAAAPLWTTGSLEPVHASAAWSNDGTLHLALRYLETPFCTHLRLLRQGDVVTVSAWNNTDADTVHRWTGTAVG